MDKPGSDLLSLEIQPTIIGQRRFTVLFGMGRSGTTTVWPPGKGFDSLSVISNRQPVEFFGKEVKLDLSFLHSHVCFKSVHCSDQVYIFLCKPQAARL